MNYELAKKLNDAGFPRPEIIIDLKFLVDPEDNHRFPEMRKHIYAPNLLKLIEACGDKIEDEGYTCHFTLVHYGISNDMNWRAFYDWIDGTCLNDLEGFGSTTEEAVANLWLVINNKN